MTREKEIAKEARMKVTSFQISKKLSEIGFFAETEFYWVETEKGRKQVDYVEYEVGTFYGEWKYTKAFDLETILEALPMGLDMFDGRFVLIIDQRSFFAYANFDKGTQILQIIKQQDESLADTAARLLITLQEKDLIINEE